MTIDDLIEELQNAKSEKGNANVKIALPKSGETMKIFDIVFSPEYADVHIIAT